MGGHKSNFQLEIELVESYYAMDMEKAQTSPESEPKVEEITNRNICAENNKTSKPSGPGFVQNLSNYGVEYTKSTSLHGLQYLGERKRNICERYL